MATTRSHSATSQSKRKPRKGVRGTRSSKTKTKSESKASKAWLRRQWGKLVKRRDKWVCQECGAKPGARYVQAHHIIPVEGNEELMFRLDNGTTLCLTCHAAKHPKTAHLILRRLTMATKKKPTKKASGSKGGSAMPMKKSGGAMPMKKGC